MSRDHHPFLRDVTVDMENTASSIVACWLVFTSLFPGNVLIKSVTIFLLIWAAPFYKATRYLYIVVGNPFGKRPPERQIKWSESKSKF
jgi:hypothetical protein